MVDGEGSVKFLASEGDSSEERVIDVKSLRGSMKTYSTMLQNWVVSAREEFKCVCDMCVRKDYQKGELRDGWEDYWKDLRETKKHTVKDQKTGKLLGIMVDYVCKIGHGTSLEITGEDYKRYQEITGVKEIIEKTGANEKDASVAYHKNKGNITLAVSDLGGDPKAKAGPVELKPTKKGEKDDEDKSGD